MNLQQFLSQQSLDTLIHQFFSIQGQSIKSHQQQSTLINSIVLSLASSTKSTFSQLYQQCQYQLEVNNQQRQAVKKMCRLMVGVMGKASYLLKNIDIAYFVNEVLGFFLGKVFVTVCSADCVRCLWALISAYSLSNNNIRQSQTTKQGCCSSSSDNKGCCGSSMKSQSQQQSSGCCKGSNNTNNSSSQSCCKSSNSLQSIPPNITSHQKICKSLISKFLGDFKLHVKSYPFKVRKDIYKLINYVLKFVELSQEALLRTIAGNQRSQQQNAQQKSTGTSKPLLTQIGITKPQLLQLVTKSLCDQKDPRNMSLIFQNYLLLITLFPQQITTFNYRSQIFQNIQGYYPLSMEGDQGDFKIDPEDVFSEAELKELLDECLLNQLFVNEVREMLIEKMLAPPIHEYVGLYVKFITKFNPATYRYTREVDMEDELKKYSILTMNLLNRLCEQQYLEQNYESSSCHEGGCGDSSCGSGSSKSACSDNSFTIAQLISTIVKNVFLFTSPSKTSIIPRNLYQVYSKTCEQKYVQFLNTLIIHKLFNHQDNNKHAGTIIDIVKTILNPDSKALSQNKSGNSSLQKAQQQSHSNNDSCCGGGSSSQPKNDGGCCGGGGCGSSTGGCGTSTSKHSHPNIIPSIVSPTKLPYGHKISYQQMLTTFITYKFMQYWSAKGDVAFKLGLLILALNKKLQTISIDTFLYPSSPLNQSTQNTLQHLLITLGNVYQTHIKTDQIKIMVLKTLMIMISMFAKLYTTAQSQQKNINKIRKINNSIVHKDCLRFSLLLREISQQKSQENQFSRSQNHILKSYVDYLMEVYVNNEVGSEVIVKETDEMLLNLFGAFANDHLFEDMGKIESIVKYFDVKLYAAVRYLSIHASKQTQSISNKKIVLQPIKLILSILYSPNQQLTNKLVTLLKYYTYPTLLSLIALVFRHISIISTIPSQTSEILSQSLFINISLIGKVIAQKFDQWHIVEMEINENYGRVVIGDIQKCFQSQLINSKDNSTNKVTKILLWYMFKKVWRREKAENLEIAFGDLEKINGQTKEQQLLQNIYTSTKQRITLWLQLHSYQSNYNQLTLPQISWQFHDLHCTLLYIKYLKAHSQQQTLRFTKNLSQLYDPGMIQYFWNRLLSCMSYSEKSIISPQAKQQLIQLIQHLPQKILVMHAQQIAPVIIYETVKSEMVEQSKEGLKARDQFDYQKTELISKLTENLPESSLIIYVLPYCLNFLKIAAISCQKNINIPEDIITPNQSIRALLNVNKIIHILIEKSHEKASQKTLKYEKLKKSLFETHKKQFNTYFSRLIYHKKRVIRQSSRNLLMSFE